MRFDKFACTGHSVALQTVAASQTYIFAAIGSLDYAESQWKESEDEGKMKCLNFFKLVELVVQIRIAE